MSDPEAQAIAELKMELEQFSKRLTELEHRVGKVEPMVLDLRTEVAELMKQVSRGTKISLETQGEMREAFRAIQRQNELILERLTTPSK
jgi:chromosome segregation ATPase